MSDPKQNHFDLCIIGCGPAGFAAAMRAFDAGKHTCIIEGGEIGGTGVMWGALSSKTMWELAKDYAVAAKVDRGYRASGLTADYRAVRNSVLQAVKEKQYQMLSQVETFSPRRWSGEGSITYLRGWGAFQSEDTVQVRLVDGGTQAVKAEFFLIATGSRPREFPGIPTDGERILNSDQVLNLTEFPRRLMIIGAGIIGCEYSAIFSNFGQTKVYLADHAERIIPYEDEDISDFVSSHLKANGVKIFQTANLQEIIERPDHLEVVLDFADGRSEVVEVDTVLISIGRTPNIERLNLDRLGISPNERGVLQTDENCRVTNHIYACGDVTHHPNLVNLAEMEGRYAVKHMYGLAQHPLNYDNMSTVMFFRPAVAAVGLNEKGCRRKNIPYRVASYGNALVSRAIAMRATDGFSKIIVSDDDQQRLLGMRAAGPMASNNIMTIALLMDHSPGLADALKTVHPHPTMSEGIQECLRVLLDKSIFKERAFPELVKVRSWAPEVEG
ncbi:MAG: NAD(P)/FAD-dependent oxidoreductase [Desulfobacterales bacterium]|jgi:dihydrolipoamide dehydrogenase